ncbi:kinase-like domain-containing protein [Hypoxylon sp. FL1284]|nr:kinase-like domain-containing protein [Hypoxylon sp. FL1284]
MALILPSCRPRLCRLANRVSCRMASTVLGKPTVLGNSGTLYLQDALLRAHPQHPELGEFKCHAVPTRRQRTKDDYCHMTRATKELYHLSRQLEHEFGGVRGLRMHVDFNDEENVLIYPRYTHTLHTLMRDEPDLSMQNRRKILRRVVEAIHQLHLRFYVHLDINPHTILVNWRQADKRVTDVALSNFEYAVKVGYEPETNSFHFMGNALWRSPEGHTGRGLHKSSDIFSLGLVFVYALVDQKRLVFDLPERGTRFDISQRVLTTHFSYFGLARKTIRRRVAKKRAIQILKRASTDARLVCKKKPELKFKHWGADLLPELQDLIAGMTQINPNGRLPIKQILRHPWWEVDDVEKRT